MNIQKLISFLTVAEYESFTKASEVLYLSQPAISKQVDSLENELNVKLFDRVRNKISLTIQGKHFKTYAEEIVKLYHNAKDHVVQIENLEEGSINFGSTNFIGIHLMPKILNEFHSEYPNIDINLAINSSNKLFNMLEKQEIEFVFLSHYVNIDEEKYTSIPFIKDELVLIVGKDHPLFHDKTCRLGDLSDYTLITKDLRSSLYKFLGENIKKLNFKKEIIIGNQEAIKHAVVNGMGVAFMSKMAVELEVKSGLINTLKIEDCDLKRDINLVFDKRKYITPAGKAFLELLNFM